MLKSIFLRNVTLFFFLVCPFWISAQAGLGNAAIKNRKGVLHYTSYYISTDVLSFLNYVISKENKKVTLSGEVCFDHLHGFQLNLNLGTEYFDNYIRSDFIVKPEFRLYYLNEDCSAFHIGAYCSFEEAEVSYRKNSTLNSHLDYKESIFETGLSGGYKVLINDRWVINPVAYAGISNRYRFRSLDKNNSPHFFTEARMEISVVLQVGYRF